MAGRSKDKEKVKGLARRHPEWDNIEASAKIRKRSASSRSTPSARRSSKTPSKPSSTAASPAPPAVNGRNNRDREASTPSSDTSQAVKDFYAHMEATSSESSRWDTDSVLGAVLEDLTHETGTPGGEITPIYSPLLMLYSSRLCLYISCCSLPSFFPAHHYLQLMSYSCCLHVFIRARCNMLISYEPRETLHISPSAKWTQRSGLEKTGRCVSITWRLGHEVFLSAYWNNQESSPICILLTTISRL